MKNPFSKETQFELFPETSVSETHKQPSYDIFNRTFYVSLENFAVAGIIIAVIVVVAFAFGIERGRRMKSAEPGVAALVAVRQIQPPAGREAQPQRNISGDAQAVPVPAVSAVVPEAVPVIEKKIPAAAPEKSIDKTASLETIHTVQVASFRQLGTAQKEVDDLKKGGYDAFAVQKGSHYIVCVGRFSDSQQANEMMRLLRRKYSDCYVRRL